ncbi:MAG: M23 family metallopeptidase [Neisseria sp.]|nr:M23 family metallopeptidase [Neisseria sp.]
MTETKKNIRNPIFFGRNALLAAALSACAVTAYAVTEPQPKQPDYQTARVVEELPAISFAETERPGSYWTEEAVQEGETLSDTLGRLGMPAAEIRQILGKKSIDGKLQILKSGQTFSVRVDSAGQATDIQFFHDDDNGERNLVAVEKVNGKWQVSSSEINIETMPTLRSVVVRTSAKGSLAQAGVGVSLRESLRDIFSDRFNVDELQNGDQIRLLYNTMYFRGQAVDNGDILAAEIIKNGKSYKAYLYDNGDEGSSYYDEKGKPLKAASTAGFNFQPVKGARISSPFGTRVHPIFHTVRMHTGIDYAAPIGTPVYAPADGVMTFKGWQGGYGHTVMLKHSNGVETLYAHLSAFSPAQGNVKAGEVIGFVGSSGNSTGSHLHYEARINGSPVNPATVALPAPKMETVNMAKFRKQQTQADSLMVAIRDLPVTVARLY